MYVGGVGGGCIGCRVSTDVDVCANNRLSPLHPLHHITCTADRHFCNRCVTLRHDNIIEVQRVFLNNLNHEVGPIPFIASLA